MNTQIVPSGSFVVSEQDNRMLTAYLGTCVGVVLWDRKRKVGGLIHLLLPHSAGMHELWRPEIYAQTGLPLFIKTLVEAGASKARLEACVAGGALIVPLTAMDLAQDIGGRTAELVETVLQAEEIPIRQSEVGGCFGFRMSLNLMTFETTIEPADFPAGHMGGIDLEKPDHEAFRHRMEHLRPIPQTALKILRLIEHDTCSAREIAGEVKKDQVISAGVLKLCNSAFMRQREKIESIDRAVVVLGNKMVLQLVLSASLKEILTENGRGYSLCKGALFKHALGTAVMSSRLAELSRRVPGHLAYTAGLLHDIGKVLLDQWMTSAHPLFYRKIRYDGASLLEVEREYFGMDHCEAGEELARHWNLPETLSEVMKSHHTPSLATLRPDLVHTVHVADQVMCRFMAELRGHKFDEPSLMHSLRTLGFGAGQLLPLLDFLVNSAISYPML